MSAPIVEDSSQDASLTEQLVYDEKVVPLHNEQLLTELTSTEKIESQPVVKEQKVDEEQIESQQPPRDGQIKKDILDRLTGPSNPTEDKQTENS